MAMDLFAFMDAIKFLADTNDFDIKKGIKNAMTNPASIAQSARKNICQFPLLISDTISVEGCSEISRVLEELYANYIKIIVDNNNDIIDLSKESKETYISHFHQNDSVGNYGMNPITDYETITNMNESTKFITDESTKFLAKHQFGYEAICKANQELLKPYNENFNNSNMNSNINGSYLNEEILNEASTPNFDNSNIFTNMLRLTNRVGSLFNDLKNRVDKIRQDVNNLYDTCRVINYNDFSRQYSFIVRDNQTIKNTVSTLTSECENLKAFYDNTFKYLYQRARKNPNGFPNSGDIISLGMTVGSLILDILVAEEPKRIQENLSNSINEHLKTLKDYYNQEIENRSNQANIDSKTADEIRKQAEEKRKENQEQRTQEKHELDVIQKTLEIKELEKKLNKKDPTNMQVSSFYSSITKQNSVLSPTVLSVELQYNATNGNLYHTKLDIGIKTIIHMIPSAEMCYFLPDSLIKKRLIFRFIQWTTGEIKFMRDFVLDLDNVKFQATTDKKSIKWWKHLNTRRNAAKVRSFTNRKVNFVPNATIVLSTADVEFIKYKNSIDLRKQTDMAAKLMDYFFLLHLVIVDEVEGTISLFHSDTRTWETMSIDKLKAETRNELKKNNGVVQFSR